MTKLAYSRWKASSPRQQHSAGDRWRDELAGDHSPWPVTSSSPWLRLGNRGSALLLGDEQHRQQRGAGGQLRRSGRGPAAGELHAERGLHGHLRMHQWRGEPPQGFEQGDRLRRRFGADNRQAQERPGSIELECRTAFGGVVLLPQRSDPGPSQGHLHWYHAHGHDQRSEHRGLLRIRSAGRSPSCSLVHEQRGIPRRGRSIRTYPFTFSCSVGALGSRSEPSASSGL